MRRSCIPARHVPVEVHVQWQRPAMADQYQQVIRRQNGRRRSCAVGQEFRYVGGDLGPRLSSLSGDEQKDPNNYPAVLVFGPQPGGWNDDFAVGQQLELPKGFFSLPKIRYIHFKHKQVTSVSIINKEEFSSKAGSAALAAAGFILAGPLGFWLD